jgi:hypothetical protein
MSLIVFVIDISCHNFFFKILVYNFSKKMVQNLVHNFSKIIWFNFFVHHFSKKIWRITFLKSFDLNFFVLTFFKKLFQHFHNIFLFFCDFSFSFFVLALCACIGCSGGAVGDHHPT